MLCWGFIACESVGVTLLSVTIQMKAINQHFTVELLNMLRWEFIAFESVGVTLLSVTIFARGYLFQCVCLTSQASNQIPSQTAGSTERVKTRHPP